ncbi:MAG TPA: amidase family protein, partial [Tetrasphaera sp.]|nr:amidase family protein [Tetrasphaera sp.]
MTTPPAACEVLNLPLADLAAALRTGSHSVADVIAACLERIAQRNGPLNAVEAVLAEPVLADAARLDALDPADRATLPLFGVPVAIKSEIDVAGVVTTFGGQGNTRPAAAVEPHRPPGDRAAARAHE